MTEIARKVATRYLQAKRQIMYHGTSTAYLRRILKEGLLPAPGDKQFPDVRPHFGNYSGVYFLRKFEQAIHYARRTAKQRGGDPLMVVAQIETRTPGATVDEEYLVKKIDDAVVEATRWSVGTVGQADRVHLDNADYSKILKLFEESPTDTQFTQTVKQQQAKLYRQFGLKTIVRWYEELSKHKPITVNFDLAYTYPSDSQISQVTDRAFNSILDRVWEKGGEISDLELKWLKLALMDMDTVIRHFMIYRDLDFIALGNINYTKDVALIRADHLEWFRKKIKDIAKQLKGLVDKPLGDEIGVVVQDPVTYGGSNRILKITGYPVKGKPTIYYDRS